MKPAPPVEEAIAFYENHNEPGFARGNILVADRTGASAAIGFRNGSLHIERAMTCRALGAMETIASRMLAADNTPTPAHAAHILRASMQRRFFGAFGTQYSNVFDLKSGEIFVFQFPRSDVPTRFKLAEELKKGAHVFENPTPWEPYAFVAALTGLPSLAFMLVASVLRRRRKLAVASALLAILWAVMTGVYFHLLGQDGRANSLTLVPVGLTPLIVILSVIWFARIRSADKRVRVGLT